MKKLAMLCVLLALCLPCCNKKKSAPTTKKATSSKVTNDKNIPVYKQDEDFLDDESVSDFAFVDDEAKKDKLAKGDSSESKDKTLALLDGESEEDLQDEVDSDKASNQPSSAFKTVYFDFNKDNIRTDQSDVIKSDIQVAKATLDEGKEIVVQGHCDQLGEAAYNLVLSQRRAEAIKTQMAQAGLPSEKIKTVGFGFEMPVVWSALRKTSTIHTRILCCSADY